MKREIRSAITICYFACMIVTGWEAIPLMSAAATGTGSSAQKKEEWNGSISALIKETASHQARNAQDWKNLFSKLSPNLCENNRFRLSDADFQKADMLCQRIFAEVQSQHASRRLVAQARVNLAIVQAAFAQGRKAWDQYDLSSQILEESDPDLLVSLLTSLGSNFHYSVSNDDSLHAFELADRLCDTHTITEETQAKLYNTASDAIFRASDCRDDSRTPFYRYVQKALALDTKLGAKYLDELNEMTIIKASRENQDRQSGLSAPALQP